MTVVSLVSHFIGKGKNNLLGSFIGSWWSDSLLKLSGSVPLTFLIVATISLGINCIKENKTFNYRSPVLWVCLYVSSLF